MCLIVSTKASIQFTDEEVRDFYTRNRDGVGVMWAEGGVLHMRKRLPADADALLRFWREFVDGKDCVVHLRMRTHGVVDLENAHPYPVLGFDDETHNTGPILLIHNGVLHTDNHGDPARSDTWHYIRNYLRPILRGNAALIHDKHFQELISHHIGVSNRFVLMDASGVPVILNERTGLTYKGAWFSNTYAWSAAKFMPPKKYDLAPVRYGTGKGYSAVTSNEQAFQKWLESRDKFNDLNRRAEDPGLGKSKKARKLRASKTAKQMKLPIGSSTATTGGTGKDEPRRQYVDTGSGELIRTDMVEDVLEIRRMLDTVHPTNMTKDADIESLLRSLEVSDVYYILELMFEGRLLGSAWDNLVNFPLHRKQAMDRIRSTFKEHAYVATPQTH